MKRSEEIRREIQTNERLKLKIMKEAMRAVKEINVTILDCTRELDEIRDGGQMDEEI